MVSTTQHFRRWLSLFAAVLVMASLGCDQPGQVGDEKPSGSEVKPAATTENDPDNEAAAPTASAESKEKWIVVLSEGVFEYDVDIPVTKEVEENGETKTVTVTETQTRTRTETLAKLVLSDEGETLDKLKIPEGWKLVEADGQPPRLERTSDPASPEDGEIALPPLTPPDPLNPSAPEPATGGEKLPQKSLDDLFGEPK